MKTKITWLFLVEAVILSIIPIWIAIESPLWATNILNTLVGACLLLASILVVVISILLARLAEKLA